MSYSIERITELIQATRNGAIPAEIDWLLTDSRSLCYPAKTLFFALKSQRNNGNKYIKELFKKGVRNFVVEELPDPSLAQKANFLIVDSTLAALQLLTKKHRQQFETPVIGIAGSNGKTIVKEWLYQLLYESKHITRSPRSYNSQIGVPLSVWHMDEDTELSIFEAGISQVGEMNVLEEIIKPTIGIFTNLSGAHQENFSSLQQKCLEKLLLFKDCDTIIYNGDNELISDCIAKSLFSSREIAWSTEDTEKPLYIQSIEKKEESTLIQYRYLQLDYSYEIPFIDDASIENSIHCLAVCLYLMVRPEIIAERMAHLEQITMRMEVKEGKNGCTLINDTYNSDLVSLDIALDFLYRRALSNKLKPTLIISDLFETGQSSQLLYKEVAQYAHLRGVECLIGIGKEISENKRSFSMESYFFPNTESFLASDLCKTLSNQIILIKGAHNSHFEQITEQLELKVHETILSIDLDAVVKNLNHYRGMLQPKTDVICMVKASAYGAGPYEVAKTLQEEQVNVLAVAVADEGVELRNAGITCPIIIMNPELSAFNTMFKHQLEPEIYSFYLLKAFIKAANKSGITNFPVHIKLDTGMHRLGFSLDEIPKLIQLLSTQSSVFPLSIFSHFAGSDNPALDTYTRGQIACFEKGSTMIQNAFRFQIKRHICNTAGIERFPEAHYDAVRIGIGLYGIDPITNKTLNNVLTLETTILEIKNLTAEETVGYGREGVLQKDSRIAAIPIGYADGLNRHLGNRKGYCLVNGREAPYVGNICMDVCMIDVTDIDCKEGDRAIIFGEQLPVSKLSNWLTTIPYEIFTNISRRVKRIYYHG